MTVTYQIPLPLEAVETPVSQVDLPTDYRERLITLLSQDLDFHELDSGYASHNFHSFPAKFPPQLPRKFIEGLTSARETVLDPMSGSGTKVVYDITSVDDKKGRILHRYYSEMTRTLREFYRVLKPGKAAIVVVGSSTMRGKDTQTATCLADIGQSIGFEVPKVRVRHLDRNHRMMPAGNKVDSDSQIQQRMHEEYVIGFYKPEHK